MYRVCRREKYLTPEWRFPIKPFIWLNMRLWEFLPGVPLVKGSGFPWGLLAFCACFGIADECWQDWLGSGRSPDAWDAAADAAGAFIGLILSMVFWKR